MSVQNMISWIKNHNRAIIVLFVILSLGLVGSYAFMGVSGVGNGGEPTTKQKISAYTDAIEKQIELIETENTLANNEALGDLYYERASLYLEAEKDEKATNDYKDAAVVFDKILKDNKDLNDTKKALVNVKLGNCYVLSGDKVKAEETLKTAYALDNKQIDVIWSYGIFLLNEKRYEEAYNMVGNFRTGMAKDDANIQLVDALINVIQSQWSESLKPEADKDAPAKDEQKPAEQKDETK